MVQYGVENLRDWAHLLKGKRLGLITSPTGLTQEFVSTVDLLHEQFHLAALFSPEHGVRGDQEAGGLIETYRDERTGVPVYSLYRQDSKRLTPEMLDQVDMVVYDIQDAGARFYTFIYTMLYALEDCAKAGKAFMVLDRPNPLGGAVVEGNRLREGFQSFVGNYPGLAIRYGLTAGELALMANDQLGLKADLYVAQMKDWSRHMLFPDTGNMWVPPSMGLPRFGTALLYPGTCLIEGTNLSEGRGTPLPFELIGAPYLDGDRLASEMNRLALPGVRFRSAHFKPSFSKHQGELCHGVQVHITDLRALRPVETGIRLIDILRRNWEEFAFLEPFREGGRPCMDLLWGDSLLREGALPVEALLEQLQEESAAFAKEKEKYHLYV
ncbi:MAG: hypothetical protein K0Q90_5 [Paenibacillaceae bacterium]|jgi:uncharacterized protein YbbC (DUF1343 family)|nr:hypothetical protein [Paenibacillaceae bacterium]